MSNRSRERPETNLVKLTGHDVLNAHRIFGSRFGVGTLPMIIVPESRSALSLRMIIPDGTHCIVTENAKAIGVFKPGLYYRSTFFQISHVVTTQYVPYHFSVNDCPTRDNVRINIHVDFLLHVTNANTFVHKMGLDNIEDLLRATQSEAVRSLVRSSYVNKAYDLRGQDSENMLETLNDKLGPFGVSIDQVSIASVVLPKDVAYSLQEATTIQAKKAKQLKVQELSMRSQNALQYINKIRIDKRNELEKYKENMQKEYDIIVNDMKEIQAKKDKEMQRLDAQLRDKREQLQAQGAFESGKLDAQRDLEVNDIKNNAQIESQKIIAEGALYVAQVRADVEFKVAQNKAKIINLRGEAERIAQNILAAQREFEYQMKQIDVLTSVAENNRNVVTNEAANNEIAKLLATSTTAEAMGIKLRKV